MKRKEKRLENSKEERKKFPFISTSSLHRSAIVKFTLIHSYNRCDSPVDICVRVLMIQRTEKKEEKKQLKAYKKLCSTLVSCLPCFREIECVFTESQ